MARRGAPADMFLETFKGLVPKYLDDRWTPQEGYSPDELKDLLAAADLPAGLQLPLVLDEFYRALGRCEEILEADHFFFDPDELTVEDGRLLFLEDEGERWIWGVAVDALDVPDPLIHRAPQAGETAERSAAAGAGDRWEQEGATVSEFVFDLLDFSFDTETH